MSQKQRQTQSNAQKTRRPSRKPKVWRTRIERSSHWLGGRYVGKKKRTQEKNTSNQKLTTKNCNFNKERESSNTTCKCNSWKSQTKQTTRTTVERCYIETYCTSEPEARSNAREGGVGNMSINEIPKAASKSKQPGKYQGHDDRTGEIQNTFEPPRLRSRGKKTHILAARGRAGTRLQRRWEQAQNGASSWAWQGNVTGIWTPRPNKKASGLIIGEKRDAVNQKIRHIAVSPTTRITGPMKVFPDEGRPGGENRTRWIKKNPASSRILIPMEIG